MSAATAMAPIKTRLTHHDEAIFLAIAVWADEDAGICTKSVNDIAVLFGNPRSIYRTLDRLRNLEFVDGSVGAIRPLISITDMWPY